MFVVGRHAVAQLQVGGKDHEFGDGQVRAQLVSLHDVTRHFAESAQVALDAVDPYAARDARNAVKTWLVVSFHKPTRAFQ